MIRVENLRIGDAVLLKNFTGPGWLPGKIVETSGPVSFHVLLKDGRCKRCHQDQLRPRVTDDGPPDMSEIPVTPATPETGPEPEITNSDQPNARTNPTTTSDTTESSDTSDSTDTTNSSDSNIRRYPRRQRKPREGLNREKLDVVYELSCLCVMACMSSIICLVYCSIFYKCLCVLFSYRVM